MSKPAEGRSPAIEFPFGVEISDNRVVIDELRSPPFVGAAALTLNAK
jgi:hypothetical protein